MTFIEPRSLLSDNPKHLKVGEEQERCFNQYKELMGLIGAEITPIDAFLAGWIFANPVVRSEFKMHREKEIKRDNRIDETVWK